MVPRKGAGGLAAGWALMMDGRASLGVTAVSREWHLCSTPVFGMNGINKVSYVAFAGELGDPLKFDDPCSGLEVKDRGHTDFLH